MKKLLAVLLFLCMTITLAACSVQLGETTADDQTTKQAAESQENERQVPHIVYTFFESYDFSGKTIVPFCTSGSSGVGSSATNLHSSASDSTVWLDGTRFNAGASQSDIEDWLGGLGPDIFED